MSARWLEERRRDQYYKLAKQYGYRSRASFKLLQAIKSYRVIRRGDYVVDLGSAPGGWLQVARSVVGPKGFVLGVDVSAVDPLPWANAVTLSEDITNSKLPDIILGKTGRKVDVVTSDVSPNISGVWDVDHAKQIHLAYRSLQIALTVLRKGGCFFVKAFHGPELSAFRTELAQNFERVRNVKPPASRTRSSEIYLLGLSFRG